MGWLQDIFKNERRLEEIEIQELELLQEILAVQNNQIDFLNFALGILVGVILCGIFWNNMKE